MANFSYALDVAGSCSGSGIDLDLDDVAGSSSGFAANFSSASGLALDGSSSGFATYFSSPSGLDLDLAGSVASASALNRDLDGSSSGAYFSSPSGLDLDLAGSVASASALNLYLDGSSSGPYFSSAAASASASALASGSGSEPSTWSGKATTALMDILVVCSRAASESGGETPLPLGGARFWEEISRQLGVRGFQRTGPECRDRYRSISDYYSRAASNYKDDYRYSDGLVATMPLIDLNKRDADEPPPPKRARRKVVRSSSGAPHSTQQGAHYYFSDSELQVQGLRSEVDALRAEVGALRAEVQGLRLQLLHASSNYLADPLLLL